MKEKKTGTKKRKNIIGCLKDKMRYIKLHAVLSIMDWWANLIAGECIHDALNKASVRVLNKANV